MFSKFHPRHTRFVGQELKQQEIPPCKCVFTLWFLAFVSQHRFRVDDQLLSLRATSQQANFSFHLSGISFATAVHFVHFSPKYFSCKSVITEHVIFEAIILRFPITDNTWTQKLLSDLRSLSISERLRSRSWKGK